MARLFISIAIMLGSAVAAWAEPLDLKQLPKAATWVVHIDIDAANSSLVGQHVRDLWLSQPDGIKATKKAQEIFGMDLTRDLHSVTLYGTNFVPDHGVVIIRGKLDQPRLVALLKKAPGYREQIIDGHQIYSWIDNDGPGHQNGARPTTTGSFFSSDVIVMGREAQEVSSAIDVLEGKSPALATDSPLCIPEMQSAIVSMAAMGLNDPNNLVIQSPIVRDCQSGGIAVGEKDGQFTISSRIVTEDSQKAGYMRDIIVGVKGFMISTYPDIQQSKLLDAVSVTTEGKAVVVAWQYPAKELIKFADTFLPRLQASTQSSGTKS